MQWLYQGDIVQVWPSSANSWKETVQFCAKSTKNQNWSKTREDDAADKWREGASQKTHKHPPE